MASGGVNSWPDYMQYEHSWWLGGMDADDMTGATAQRTATFYVDSDINSARGLNPYVSVSPYDPSTDIMDIESKLSTYSTRVGTHSPESDFVGLTGRMSELGPGDPGVDELPSINLSTHIDDAAIAYENKIGPELFRSVGRMAATFHEANAVQTTGFIFGIMDLERNQNDKITDFRDKIRSSFEEKKLMYEIDGNLQTQKLKASSDDSTFQTRLRFAAVAASEVIRDNFMVTSLIGDLASRQVDLSKVKIVAFKEQNDMGITLDAKRITWNLDLYAYGGNMLAAQSGGVYRTAGDVSSLEKWVSGILGAASAAGISVPAIGKEIWDFAKSWGDDSKMLG